ncbi:MAG: polymer-forming cytoskeletal protein [Paludibacteraceae bacterium]|nr:polymer-forming cytoskeletal protein [Paludibacteraceae bacterium]MBP6284245.1 polymer-forming cytoskeletal protein [Paludibacteraceae bacterium]
MAKQEEINVSISHNTIAAGTFIKGEIRSEGDVRIDGSVEGTIICKGKIIIGTKGEFKGTITAVNVDVMGSVTGQIISENLLTIKSTGKIEGEVTTKTIIIEQEATLNGSCKMTSNIENKLKVEPILPNLTSVSKDGKVNK